MLALLRMGRSQDWAVWFSICDFATVSGRFAKFFFAAIRRAASFVSIFAVGTAGQRRATPRFTSELRHGPSLRGAVLLGPETAERTLLLTKA